MQVDSVNNKSVNFKWNVKTHREMTLLALKDSGMGEAVKKKLAVTSQMPDFLKSERGYHNNTHFYFPNSKRKSFGKDSDRLNAYNQFKEHVITALVSKDDDNFLKHAGYALHYLQDMTVPFHTEEGGVLHKILKYSLHKEFECETKFGVVTNHEKLIKNYKSQKVPYTTLLDLFKNTALFSQNPKFRVTNTNKKKWYSIQQECFDMGVNTTREFVEKLLSVRNSFNQ